MNELISYEPGIVGETSAISFVKCVKLNLVDASKAFFEIGFRLKEAQDNKYYEELGFDNLVDCAEHHFNFKKTTTYELIKIYEKFHREDAPMRIIEGLEDFNQSQLSVMASNVPDEWTDRFRIYLSLFSPADTVRKIKYASDCYRAVYNSNCSHIPFDVIRGCKTADELIKNVQEYTLSNFKWVKVNYPKVITPELEARYYALKEAPVDNGDTIKPNIEVASEPVVAEEVLTSAPQKELEDVIVLEKVQSDVQFSAPEEDVSEYIRTIVDNMHKNLYDDFYYHIIAFFNKCDSVDVALYPEKVAKKMLSALHSVFKSKKAYLTEFLNKSLNYNYELTLNGRKQALTVFFWCSS